jgi:serine/threonine-protein kinase
MDPRSVNPDLDSDLPLPESDAGSRGILSEGARFLSYVVGPCIGHGGMARIYRAQHEALQRQVALKVMKGVAGNVESRMRFTREARIAAGIKHPNVVNIFDVGVHQGIAYLAMELLEGQDLESLLNAHGAINERRMVDLMVPIVAALLAVHDAGVIHRDLKPGNVFLARGKNGEIEPKLLDFGVSKGAESDLLKLSWANGPLLGTPAYVSPEAAAGQDVTPLSDQYSLGVLMYECVVGVHPFAAKTMEETLALISVGKAVPPRERMPELSKPIASLIERAMSLDPAARYPDLRLLGRELLFMAGQRTRMTWALTFGVDVDSSTVPPGDVVSIPPMAGTVPTGVSPIAGPPSRGKRAAIGAAAGIAIVGLLVVTLLRGRTVTMRFNTADSTFVTPILDTPAAPPRPVTLPAAQALPAQDVPAPVVLPTRASPPQPSLPTDSDPAAAPSTPPINAAEFSFERPAATARERAPAGSTSGPHPRQATAGAPAVAAPRPAVSAPAAPSPAEKAVRQVPAERAPTMGANGAPIFD